MEPSVIRLGREATLSVPSLLLASVLLGFGMPASAAQEQYPKPLVHTPTDHPAARVLLLVVNGLHAVDLANFVAAHPYSALAELSRRGVTYTNAHTPAADPVAGLVSLATGGTPISTGILTEDGFDHSLSPPGSNCRTLGASIQLGPAVDSESHAPHDPTRACAAMPPHALLRVNTMFEVVQQKIGPTAWAGDNPAATDLLRGPSGKGIDDSCGPGLSAAASAREADQVRVAAVLHWIHGKDCTGTRDSPAPALFGMTFTCIATAQRTPGMGYTDASGTPSAGLAEALAFTDQAIAQILKELKATALYDSTWIFVVAPYAQSPIDQRRLRAIPLAELQAAAEASHPGLVAHIAGGSVGLIWLTDHAKTAAVASALGAQAAALGIQDMYWGERLTLTLNSPTRDNRMPDLLLQPQLGVLWTAPGEKTVAGYGGTLDEDTHVALLVSGAQLTGRYDPTWVPTTQLAPLLLRALGMEKFDLDALHQEHSPALPGIF